MANPDLVPPEKTNNNNKTKQKTVTKNEEPGRNPCPLVEREHTPHFRAGLGVKNHASEPSLFRDGVKQGPEWVTDLPESQRNV